MSTSAANPAMTVLRNTSNGEVEGPDAALDHAPCAQNGPGAHSALA